MHIQKLPTCARLSPSDTIKSGPSGLKIEYKAREKVHGILVLGTSASCIEMTQARIRLIVQTLQKQGIQKPNQTTIVRAFEIEYGASFSPYIELQYNRRGKNMLESEQ